MQKLVVLDYVLKERLGLHLTFATAFLDISMLLVKVGHPKKQPGSVPMGKHTLLKLPSVPVCPSHTFGLGCFLLRLLMILGNEFQSVVAYGPLVFHNIQMGVMTVYFFYFFLTKKCGTPHTLVSTSARTGRGCKQHLRLGCGGQPSP